MSVEEPLDLIRLSIDERIFVKCRGVKMICVGTAGWHNRQCGESCTHVYALNFTAEQLITFRLLHV